MSRSNAFWAKMWAATVWFSLVPAVSVAPATAPSGPRPTAAPRRDVMRGGSLVRLRGKGVDGVDTWSADLFPASGDDAPEMRFMLRITTAETGRVAADSLFVSVVNSAGRRLATLAIFSNVDARLYSVAREVRVAIPRRFAQDGNRISLEATEDRGRATAFFVDWPATQ